jgi:hypothetical protein
MTPAELSARLRDACEARTPATTRNRQLIVSHWLRLVVSSDRGIMEYASAQTVSARRQILRRAGVAPVHNAAGLADLAAALGVRPDDRAAILRLYWTARPPTGRTTWRDAAARFDPIVSEAAALLAGGQETRP